jgi:hypothetical protein
MSNYQQDFTSIQTHDKRKRQALVEFASAARRAIGYKVTGSRPTAEDLESIKRAIALFEKSSSGVLYTMKDLLLELEGRERGNGAG